MTNWSMRPNATEERCRANESAAANHSPGAEAGELGEYIGGWSRTGFREMNKSSRMDEEIEGAVTDGTVEVYYLKAPLELGLDPSLVAGGLRFCALVLVVQRCPAFHSAFPRLFPYTL